MIDHPEMVMCILPGKKNVKTKQNKQTNKQKTPENLGCTQAREESCKAGEWAAGFSCVQGDLGFGTG